MSVAPHYAEAFGQPREIFTSRFGLPRTDLFSRPRRRAARAARLRATYGLPEGRRVLLYAPTFRGDTVGQPATPTCWTSTSCTACWATSASCCSSSTRSSAPRLDVAAGLAGVRDRRVGRPDVNELMLVSRRPRDRLLERDLRVRAARPADRVPRTRRRRLRARARLLPRLPADTPGPIFATTDELAAAIRAGEFDLDGSARSPRRSSTCRRARDRAARGRGAAARPRGEPPATRGRARPADGRPARPIRPSGPDPVASAVAAATAPSRRSRQPEPGAERGRDREPGDQQAGQQDPADDQR